MLDLLIKNARVADGTGRAIYRGHVGVEGGVIKHVGRDDPGGATRVIDADGLVVAPGFIDPHTHLDAQVLWDRQITPSCWHGVTSAVYGNCGVGLMPVRESTREYLLRDLVNVEGIDYDVLRQGVKWNWNTPKEYFAHIEHEGLGVNLAGMVSLTPLRHYVMGDASFERAANEDEIKEMVAVFGQAVADGAFGWSTDLLMNHRGFGGRPLACRNASRDELSALCHVLRDAGRGVVSVALDSLRQGVQYINAEDVATLRFLVEESDRPVTFLPMVAMTGDLDFGAKQLARLGDIADKVVPQVSPMPIVFMHTMKKPFKFSEFAVWRPALNGTVEEQRRLYGDAEFRAAAKAEQEGHIRKIPWDRVRIAAVKRPDLQRHIGRVIGEVAREENKHPLDTFLDLTLADDLEALYQFESSNLDRDVVRSLLQEPRFMLGISDAGAHIDQICDMRYPTVLLGDWVREGQALSLEQAIWKLTGHPAKVFGIARRGQLKPGFHADITLFDPKTIGSEPPVFVDDLPAGGSRLIAKARGIVATFIDGVQVMREGAETGALPGRVIRSGED
ncbi:MAG TPA: amidohydrolase family protein [Kofleriaceae bacterium]|jgi:N-acyl-D-aspartate/D-glutamate deacylase|nr:amidohydrolase family protein [Kofleriaceae bacterium]